MKLMKARRNFRRSNAVMTFDFCSERLFLEHRAEIERRKGAISAISSLGTRVASPLFRSRPASQGGRIGGRGGREKKFPN